MRAIQDAGLVVLNHLETTESFFGQLARDPTPQRGIALGVPALQLAEAIAF